ncbi:probable disease resistance protein At4g27220 [Durio zibethinus]|uniref:Probable disease resistance protein At4g27220 n=1 Tax=Durio zibethinus TaxID=66656 RepID=A0A6P5Y518_DURZI|nr:probable disease resistance protein At4g27220 [Durio zibethinus]
MAAEFAASGAANAVGNLATEYASPYVGYFFRFGKIVEEFKNRRKELELKSDRVKNDVEEARRQNEVIEKDVQDWQQRAETELKETQSLEAEIERKKCFNWCPSWGWRYCLSKKVAKKTISINKLLESCNFPRVGHLAPLQGIEFFPSKDFMPNESSKFTFNEIIKALNTDGVNMIGLYGMPGVGKTTLAKEVGKHAKEQNLFHKVVMATMSQTPNINKIQDKFAELLGLKFKASTEEGKAEELRLRLLGVNKILIIIDDVWDDFKLRTIGIPFGVEHEGCKILLTTRDPQVCVRMDCQQIFKLNILSKCEAWALFKDTARLKDVSSRLNDVAKEVASECKGLPLAIVTIGKALKGANLDGWQAANKRLKDSRHLDNEEVSQDIYNCLKLSYDYLKGDNIRTCFLLCSLFPEDWDIEIEELIMFAIGYGLFSNINLIEDLRREIREALRKLQDSGLLLRNDDDERYVRMHDVVRDFAHWITSTGKNIFMVKEGLMEWPLRESCGSHTAISFWNSNINIFPEKLKFPKLKILIFTGKILVKDPIAFVEGMKALQVLHLKNVIFSIEVLKLITNLRTLCLVECELENISSLANMKNLEILAFSDTNIYEVPEELVALRKLKSLHFSHSRGKKLNFPPTLLSRLTSLRELHVTCENNVNLLELNSLSRLTGLSLRVSTAQCFPENLVFPKLQSYNIAVNEDLRFMQELNSRTLEITEFSSSLSAFEKLLCSVEKLALKNVMGHKNIVPNIDPKCVGELTSLWLQKCDDMECLVDTTGEKGPTAFSNLVKLRMMEMACLKELCHGPPPISFLQKLKDVTIEYCTRLKVVFEMDGLLEKEEISQTLLLSNLTSLNLSSLPELESIWKSQSTHQYHASLRSLKVVNISWCDELKAIFPPCLAQSLLHLQELEIFECDRLEQVFDFPQEVGELEVRPLSNLTSLELTSLPELKWIWKGPTHLVNLQSLKTMRIWECAKLAYLFSTPLAQSLEHLEELEIKDCGFLEHVIFGEAENEDQIVSNVDGYPFRWPKLRTLKIINCGRLNYVFPITLAQGLPYLESVEITDCSQLKQVFNMTKDKGGRPLQDIVLQRLQFLRLKNLEKLSSFCPENFVMSLSLKMFEVFSCPQLTEFKTLQANLKDVRILAMDGIMYHKNLIPSVDPQGLNELTFLTLRDDKELECLIDTADQGHVSTVPLLPNLTSLKLKSLPELKWIWKGPTHHVCFQSLKVAVISRCNKLKYLFSPSLVQSLVMLEQLKIEYCDELEHIATELEIDDNIESDSGLLHPPPLPKLTSLEIHGCPRLQYVFNVAKENNGVDNAILPPSLEKLTIVVCPRFAKFIIQQAVHKGLQLKVILYSFPYIML